MSDNSPDEFEDQFRAMTEGLAEESVEATVAYVVDSLIQCMGPTLEYVDALRMEMLDRGWSDDGAEKFAMTVYKNDMLRTMMSEEEG